MQTVHDAIQQQGQPASATEHNQGAVPAPYLRLVGDVLQRNPIADANKVVHDMKAGGAIDAAFKKETFRGQVQALMEEKGLLQPGVMCNTQGERNKRAQEFVKNDVEQRLLSLANDAIWEMLTQEAQDPQGIAAEHQSTVKQALIKMLEDEDLLACHSGTFNRSGSSGMRLELMHHEFTNWSV
eukprot:gene12428-12564_t